MPEYREPIARYHCRQCGQEYERTFVISDDERERCRYCLSYNVESLYFHPLVKVESAGPVMKYHCRNCGREHERRFQASEDGGVTCPFCRSQNVWRGSVLVR